MSKYDALFHHLNAARSAMELTFGDIEKVLGFPLPASARRHAAWWSNSGGTHVQSAAWKAAGYKSERVDIVAQTVRFVPEERGFSEMTQSTYHAPESPPAGPRKLRRHPAFGSLKGTTIVLPGVDLTEPADPEWARVYDTDYEHGVVAKPAGRTSPQ
jgi:hypothetical protein